MDWINNKYSEYGQYAQIQQQSTIDDNIAQLRDAISNGYDDYQLYNIIKQQVYKQIVYQDLAIVKVLSDLDLIGNINSKKDR